MERSTHSLAMKSQRWFVEALFRLIRQKPYEKINIAELCREAGLDRRTFYRNFKDKNDVMTFYFSTLQDEYIAVMGKEQEHTFFTLAKAQFVFWQRHLEFLKTAQMDQALLAMLRQMTNDFIAAMYIGTGGCVPKELQYNMDFVIGGFQNVLVRWALSGFQESPEQLARIVSCMFKDTVDYWPQDNKGAACIIK